MKMELLQFAIPGPFSAFNNPQRRIQKLMLTTEWIKIHQPINYLWMNATFGAIFLSSVLVDILSKRFNKNWTYQIPVVFFLPDKLLQNTCMPITKIVATMCPKKIPGSYATKSMKRVAGQNKSAAFCGMDRPLGWALAFFIGFGCCSTGLVRITITKSWSKLHQQIGPLCGFGPSPANELSWWRAFCARAWSYQRCTDLHD